jgi:hypothetical protein
VATRLGVVSTVFLGAFPAPVPHTRPAPLSLHGADEAVAALLRLEATPPTYQGPATIQTVLAQQERERERGGSVLVAATPFYAAVDPHPLGALALAEALCAAFDLEASVGYLREQRRELVQQLGHALARSEGLRDLLRRLEDELDRRAAARPAVGADIAPLIEDITGYLRQQRESGAGGTAVGGQAEV